MLDLLDADYTFVNERLAKHYGIAERLRSGFPARPGAERRPSRPARTRAACCSSRRTPNRTSPVMRGKWILENLLGSPPPLAAAQRAAAQGERRPA